MDFVMDKIVLFFQRKKAASLTLIFASFMLIQLVILRLGNQAGRGFIMPEHQELVYYGIQIPVILGFVLRSFVDNRAVKLFSLGVCFTGFWIMLLASEASLFYLIATGVTVLCLGYTGGCVYYYMSCCADVRHFGLSFGLGYAFAVAVQYLFQLRFDLKPLLGVIGFFSFAVLVIFLYTENRVVNSLANREFTAVPKFKLICAVVITVAMLMFTSYYNNYIHHLQIASNYTEYNVYSFPRLLMIPGVILFGFIGDIKKGKLLPVCTLCVTVIALLNALLTGRETYTLNMSLFYLSMSAVISYYNLTFTRLAQRTKNPAFWASAGRITDSAAVLLTFALKFSTLSAVSVLVIDIAMLSVAIVFMALNGDLNLSSIADKETEKSEPNAEITPGQIREKFGLTPKEAQVFKELTETDDKQEAIALRMNMSVNTLRHHITSIYKKTGVQTRAALCKLSVTDE